MAARVRSFQLFPKPTEASLLAIIAAAKVDLSSFRRGGRVAEERHACAMPGRQPDRVFAQGAKLPFNAD